MKITAGSMRQQMTNTFIGVSGKGHIHLLVPQPVPNEIKKQPPGYLYKSILLPDESYHSEDLYFLNESTRACAFSRYTDRSPATASAIFNTFAVSPNFSQASASYHCAPR